MYVCVQVHGLVYTEYLRIGFALSVNSLCRSPGNVTCGNFQKSCFSTSRGSLMASK